MSLNWDLSKVANSDEVCWIEATEDDPQNFVEKGKSYMNPLTNVLIWSTVSVDLPGITEENVGEFFARLRFTETLLGPFLIRAEVDGVRPEGVNAFITPEEVIAHIGLRCNVSAKTRAAWLKRWNQDLDGSRDRVEKLLAERVPA